MTVRARTAVVRSIVGSFRGGSSRPLRVETDSGVFVLKLIHGAEGPRALTAEWIVGGIASAVGLPVPERLALDLDPRLARDIDDDLELREAVARGAGLCLGLRELPGARPARADELDDAPDELALPLLWLDVVVDNPDRRRENPNILSWGRSLVPIDHGAALPFHHDWRITEDSPAAGLEPWLPLFAAHVFFDRAPRLGQVHARLARTVLPALGDVCASVPEAWLGEIEVATADRQRAAYAAFLRKRIAELGRRLDPLL